MESCDVCVVGGGPAGMAAAVAAARAGAGRVLLVERDERLGGVLPQCVHDGFGLHLYGQALTGPEYAARWEGAVRASDVRVELQTSVLAMGPAPGGGAVLDVAGPSFPGRARVRARAVVVATGCRERTRGQLMIPGTRPSGVMTAGEAQYLVNRKNLLPGDKAVVLGSGDIGLIMARRLTLEGAEVRLVLGQEATGLLRNHVRCIDDFGIPIRYGWGVASVHGNGRLAGVTVAPYGEDGAFDLGRRQYVRCNLLLLACGLLPEREVLAGVTGRDGSLSPGVFACGNAEVPHDLVDQVTQEGLRAGLEAARFVLGAAAGDMCVAHAAFGRGRTECAPTGLPESDCMLSCRPISFSDESVGAHPVRPRPEADDLEGLLAVRVREPKGRLRDVAGACAGDDRLVACTVCPSGCIVRVAADGTVTGNGCDRGREYALVELANPMRLFTGTVKVQGGGLLPVRTSAEVPLSCLRDVARACRRIVVPATTCLGDVVRPDVAATGVDLIACEDVLPCHPERSAPQGRGVEGSPRDGRR